VVVSSLCALGGHGDEHADGQAARPGRAAGSGSVHSLRFPPCNGNVAGDRELRANGLILNDVVK
jgi:hypothetical protein